MPADTTEMDAEPTAGLSSLYEGEEGAAPEGAGEAESVDEEAAEYPTALLPKSVLGGKKFSVGEEVVLKITADHGDQIEVQYATGDETDETPSAATELEEMSAEEEGKAKGY